MKSVDPEDVRTYVELQISKLQEEMDRRIETQRRETEALGNHFNAILSERSLNLDRAHLARDETAKVLIQKMEEQILSVRREVTLVNEASERAIAKADSSNHERFISHNGLIEQMRQQAVKSEQTLARLVGELLPREAFEAWKAGIEKQLSQTVGEQQGSEAEREKQRANMSSRAMWLGVALTVVWILIAVASIAVATHGFVK